jgi:hypothetical protein
MHGDITLNRASVLQPSVHGTEEVVKSAFQKWAPVTCTIRRYSEFIVKDNQGVEQTTAEAAQVPKSAEARAAPEASLPRVLEGGARFTQHSLKLPFTYSKLKDLSEVQSAAENVASAVDRNVVQTLMQRTYIQATLQEDFIKGVIKVMAKGASHYGPWLPIVSQDFKGFVEDKSITDMEVQGRLLPAMKSQLITLDEMLLVQMTPDVCRIVVGLEPRVVPWHDAHDSSQLQEYFLCVTILVPQVRGDLHGITGIALWRPSVGLAE